MGLTILGIAGRLVAGASIAGGVFTFFGVSTSAYDGEFHAAVTALLPLAVLGAWLARCEGSPTLPLRAAAATVAVGYIGQWTAGLYAMAHGDALNVANSSWMEFPQDPSPGLKAGHVFYLGSLAVLGAALTLMQRPQLKCEGSKEKAALGLLFVLAVVLYLAGTGTAFANEGLPITEVPTAYNVEYAAVNALMLGLIVVVLATRARGWVAMLCMVASSQWNQMVQFAAIYDGLKDGLKLCGSSNDLCTAYTNVVRGYAVLSLACWCALGVVAVIVWADGRLTAREPRPDRKLALWSTVVPVGCGILAWAGCSQFVFSGAQSADYGFKRQMEFNSVCTILGGLVLGAACFLDDPVRTYLRYVVVGTGIVGVANGAQFLSFPGSFDEGCAQGECAVPFGALFLFAGSVLMNLLALWPEMRAGMDVAKASKRGRFALLTLLACFFFTMGNPFYNYSSGDYADYLLCTVPLQIIGEVATAVFFYLHTLGRGRDAVSVTVGVFMVVFVLLETLTYADILGNLANSETYHFVTSDGFALVGNIAGTCGLVAMVAEFAELYRDVTADEEEAVAPAEGYAAI